ncbi:MAG: GGDEF domain-containing protein [Sulfuriferula sp.]|nr:GGDEF domain-containing protein [Sulfuriferula sp.]
MNTPISVSLTDSTDKIAHLTIWVFAGLTCLIISWAGYTLWQQSRLSSALHIMNTQHVRLAEMSTDLLEAAYNRHQTVVSQVITDDPFKRDEFRTQYDYWGNRVGIARRALMEAQLDAFGASNLQAQSKMIPHIVALQEKIVDLAIADKTNEAQQLLATQLRDIDATFDILVQNLRQHEQSKVRMYAQQAKQLSARIQLVTIILSSIIILIIISLGYAVYRSLRQRGHDIVAQGRQLEQAALHLTHDATHDALTGLANRRLFFERLGQALAWSKREYTSIGIAYIDLDKFKQINDQYGHAAGDSLLKIIAYRLQTQLREIDTLARLGGDEFAIIVMHASDSNMRQLIALLHQRISEPAHIAPNVNIQPSLTIGYALCSEHSMDADDLLAQADAAMYMGKRNKY